MIMKTNKFNLGLLMISCALINQLVQMAPVADELTTTTGTQANQSSPANFNINTQMTNSTSGNFSGSSSPTFAINSNNSVGRMIGGSSVHIESAQPSATSSSTLPLTITFISLAVVACIIAIIISALFVMRRRFSIWRLNASTKLNDKDSGNGGETGSNESVDGDNVEKKCVEDVAVEGERVTEQCTTEKQPDTIVSSTQESTNVESNEPTKPVEVVNGNVSEEIAKAVDSVDAVAPTVVESAATVPAVTSSSSLIVNVLNELSESVASKLASTAKSPSKSNLSDPEKQPLNEEQQQ
jgi:hypothetical protein